MTKVTAKPEGQTNGDLIVQITELATKKSETYTYETEQNHIFVQNESEHDIEVKVGDQTRVLAPLKQFGLETDFTKFSVKALVEGDETLQFTAHATSYGYPGKAKVENVTVNKPGLTSTKQPKETDVDTNSTASTSTEK